jgi:hypothetical protein
MNEQLEGKSKAGGFGFPINTLSTPSARKARS